MTLAGVGVTMSIRLLILSSLLLSILGFAPEAFAKHLHRAIPADVTAPQAPCVFPDGTSPSGGELHCIAPAQFMQAYGIDKLHQMGLTGKGQVIVLVDSYGSPTMQQDLDHFSDVFGLPRTTIQFVYPNGPYTNPMTTTIRSAGQVRPRWISSGRTRLRLMRRS